MNVREEDRQKNSCPSRGLGLAAAAIGVGVGAALYYFFSKRPENPDGEGSTADWSSERPHAFSTSTDTHSDIDDHSDSDSYTTVSEHSKMDTSMEDEYHNEIVNLQSESSEEPDNESDFENSESMLGLNDSVQYDSEVTEWNMRNYPMAVPGVQELRSVFELNMSTQSDSNVGIERDVTDSFMDVPSAEQLRSQIINISIMSLSRISTSTDTDTDDHNDSDSYTTVSEHSTTDTSMEDEIHNGINNLRSESSEETDNDNDFEDSESMLELNDSLQSDSEVTEWNAPDSSMNVSSAEELRSVIELNRSTQSDSDVGTEWDVTNSSMDVPSAEQMRSQIINISIMSLSRYLSPRAGRTREDEQRNQAFRERSWSLEECSICFDVILKDHKVTTLPCTHHFHSECITPWLQEQQTCPNCRKAAE